MLVEIWLLMAIMAICLFVIGIIYSRVTDGGLYVLMLSTLFMLVTALYSFNIEKVGFSSGAIVTATYKSTVLGGLFGFLALVNIVLVGVFLIESAGKKAIKG